MTKVAKKTRVVHDRCRTAAVEWVARKHQVSTAYVYAALRGDRTDGITPDIMRDFNRKYSELKKALEV